MSAVEYVAVHNANGFGWGTTTADAIGNSRPSSATKVRLYRLPPGKWRVSPIDGSVEWEEVPKEGEEPWGRMGVADEAAMSQALIDLLSKASAVAQGLENICEGSAGRLAVDLANRVEKAFDGSLDLQEKLDD